MRFSFSARQWAPLFASLVLVLASPGGFAGLPDPSSPPQPGQMPEAPEPPELTELTELPEGAELKMPKPGQAAVPQVSCLQKGNMDITRPSLPLLSCWESAASEGESASELQKACLVQMTPMKVDSALVPKCPSKALGVCTDARSGKGSLSNHYHYTPQPLSEWRKSKKNCERAGGEWHGLGNPTSWF